MSDGAVVMSRSYLSVICPACFLILTIPTVSRFYYRYNEAAEAYEEGLKTSPGDEALGRGLDDVLKAQSSARTAAGEYCVRRCAAGNNVHRFRVQCPLPETHIGFARVCSATLRIAILPQGIPLSVRAVAHDIISFYQGGTCPSGTPSNR